MQFIISTSVFAVIGGLVWGACKVLRLRAPVPTFANPQRSAIHALIAVGISMLIVILVLMLRQYLRHGAASTSTPILYRADPIPRLVVLVLYTLPAAFFMRRNGETLSSAGITLTNLWKAGLVGLGLAFLTLFFGRGGPAGTISKLHSGHLVALVYCGFVGFSEEFLFRGYLQTRLIAQRGLWCGWALSSATMAFAHFPHRMLIDGMTLAGAMAASAELLPVSLLNGYVMMRTGNVIAPGLFHTFANWVNRVR